MKIEVGKIYKSRFYLAAGVQDVIVEQIESVEVDGLSKGDRVNYIRYRKLGERPSQFDVVSEGSFIDRYIDVESLRDERLDDLGI